MKLIRQIGWGRALLFLMVVWLMFFLVAIGFLKHEPDPQTSQRISKAFKELQLLHQQRLELNQLLADYSIGDGAFKDAVKDAVMKNLQEKIEKDIALQKHANEKDFILGEKGEPSLNYEKVKRRIKMGVDELWYFISSQVRQAQKQAQELSSQQLAQTLNKILDEGIEHKRSLLKDIGTLSESDGHDNWRDKEAADLSDLVQRRIFHLQNPQDCSKAKKLLCSLNKGCGYGCQLHHIVYCLLVAYGTERTMILKSIGWRYHRQGWEDIYQPVSNTCTDPSGISVSHWPGTPNTQVIQLPIVDSIAPRPPYLPLSVPKDLAPRISRLHGDPFVWWVGQFFKYLLRPQPPTKNMLDTAAEKMNFRRPIVGIHIRRTDKIGTEAAFHSVDEYMKKVEEYYAQLAMSQDVPMKRIYLASDDPKVFFEIRQKFPEYEVLGDAGVAKTAALSTRYSDSSLNGIIMDIHFLSLSDFLVCTFSSQVCRVAYEIMQSMYADASDRFCSLDDIYYYGGQNTHRQVALMAHKARNKDQIDLEIGDTVGAFGNHWDGYSMGRNLRTNQVGLYPTFKVQDSVEAVDFPLYTEVPLKESNST